MPSTGRSADPIPFLGREDTVNYAIIIAYVWASAGFEMVVLSAALKGISQEIIEAALAESRGRIAGPSGAAARLNIPPSTLEYKIKSLGIRKSQFKFGGSARENR